MNKCLTISFSGAGHLLAYHLGVASVLLESSKSKEIPQIKAVSGSSSGAITAAVMSFIPHRLQEYSDQFLQDRGHAFRNLKIMLEEEVLQLQLQEKYQEQYHADNPEISPELYVCVTKSGDGTAHLFSYHPGRDSSQVDNLLKAVQASCRIPLSFHPADMLKSNSTYPDEGIEIDGEFYVDGGIAAPFPPPTPVDLAPPKGYDVHRVLVSPIELRPVSVGSLNDHYIFPAASKRTAFWYFKTRGDLQIRPSWRNLRALMVAGGLASSNEALRSWHARGQEDGLRFVSQEWNQREDSL